VNLRQKIEQEIRERGPIPFSRYMELCLYDPELGYYSRNAEKFGKAGDFYTSSDVHAVFGRLLARQFEEMWRALGEPGQMEILELGPGRGLFAQDVLDWSEKKFPDFFRALHYRLAENSPSLRDHLASRFRRPIEAGKASLPNPTGEDPSASSGQAARQSTDVTRRALAPEVPLIIFANEFFDALPVEVLSEKGSLRIHVREQNFVEQWAPASAEELEFLDRYSLHPEGEARTEAALQAQQRMAQYAEMMQTGFFIVIDYGYTRDEQLAGRHLGTIMAYRQHSASSNPYEAPGEQDITAHVNFTALAAAAEQNGMHAHKLLTQSQFLLGIGEANQFADAFEDCRLPQERAKVALQLKHLVTPAGVGETFHVLVASKGVDAERVVRLGGLSFARS
jgi:SAM-dependent MidA family methyltransferase